MKKLRLFKPSVGAEELNNVKKVFKKSWLGYGPLVKEFETKFQNYRHQIQLSKLGTAALHLSLLCNNFKKGKKVLVPTTFSASAAAVLYCGLSQCLLTLEKVINYGF